MLFRSATVEEVVYKGSTVDLIVRLNSGTRLLASEFFDEDDENLEYKMGETVWVEWYPGWEVVLPEPTETVDMVDMLSRTYKYSKINTFLNQFNLENYTDATEVIWKHYFEG